MDYMNFINEVDRICSVPEILSEETAKNFGSIVSKLERTHKQLVNNLHTLTVANSELKRLRTKEEFSDQKDSISERVVDLDKRVVQTLRDAVDDLEAQIGYVRSLSHAPAVEENEEEIV